MEAIIDVILLGLFEMLLEFFTWFFVIVFFIRYLLTFFSRADY